MTRFGEDSPLWPKWTHSKVGIVFSHQKHVCGKLDDAGDNEKRAGQFWRDPDAQRDDPEEGLRDLDEAEDEAHEGHPHLELAAAEQVFDLFQTHFEPEIILIKINLLKFVN